MSKAICPKHEWGYDLTAGCPWCAPKPRTRVYRKGEPVTHAPEPLFGETASVAGILRALQGAVPRVTWFVKEVPPRTLEAVPAERLNLDEAKAANNAAENARPAGAIVVIHRFGQPVAWP